MYDERGRRYLDCINNVAHGKHTAARTSSFHERDQPIATIYDLAVLQPPITLSRCVHHLATIEPRTDSGTVLCCSGPLPPGRGEGRRRANAAAQHQLALPARQSGPVRPEAAGHPARPAVCVLLCQLRVRSLHTPPGHTQATREDEGAAMGLSVGGAVATF